MELSFSSCPGAAPPERQAAGCSGERKDSKLAPSALRSARSEGWKNEEGGRERRIRASDADGAFCFVLFCSFVFLLWE